MTKPAVAIVDLKQLLAKSYRLRRIRRLKWDGYLRLLYAVCGYSHMNLNNQRAAQKP